MTLIISVISTDGVVIAGDSHSTLMGIQKHNIDFEVKCPKCNETIRHLKGFNLPSSPLLGSTSVQKICGLWGRYGVGFLGVSLINKTTPYTHLKLFEKEFINTFEGSRLEEIAIGLGEFLRKQINDDPLKPRELDLNQNVLWFQLAGFDKGDCIGSVLTVGVSIGSSKVEGKINAVDIMIGGESRFITGLQKAGMAINTLQGLSLKDAVDLAEFLIYVETQAQRFSLAPRTVGGAIDIGVVTGYGGFKWVKGKIFDSNKSGGEL